MVDAEYRSTAYPSGNGQRWPVGTVIRQLGTGDIRIARELNALFGKAFDDPATYGAEKPADDYLQTLLEKQHVIVLVALANGQVIGGLVAYELGKLERQRSEIYIYDLAVDEAHRRHGIATSLITALGSIAEQRGISVMFVQADHGDEAAIALYAGLGAREDVLHFDIAVKPE